MDRPWKVGFAKIRQARLLLTDPGVTLRQITKLLRQKGENKYQIYQNYERFIRATHRWLFIITALPILPADIWNMIFNYVDNFDIWKMVQFPVPKHFDILRFRGWRFKSSFFTGLASLMKTHIVPTNPDIIRVRLRNCEFEFVKAVQRFADMSKDISHYHTSRDGVVMFGPFPGEEIAYHPVFNRYTQLLYEIFIRDTFPFTKVGFRPGPYGRGEEYLEDNDFHLVNWLEMWAVRLRPLMSEKDIIRLRILMREFPIVYQAINFWYTERLLRINRAVGIVCQYRLIEQLPELRPIILKYKEFMYNWGIIFFLLSVFQ